MFHLFRKKEKRTTYFIIGTFAYWIMAHTIAIIIAKINDTSASGNVIIIPDSNIFGNDSKNNSILSLLKSVYYSTP